MSEDDEKMEFADGFVLRQSGLPTTHSGWTRLELNLPRSPSDEDAALRPATLGALVRCVNEGDVERPICIDSAMIRFERSFALRDAVYYLYKFSASSEEWFGVVGVRAGRIFEVGYDVIEQGLTDEQMFVKYWFPYQGGEI